MYNNSENDREIDAYKAYVNEGGANFGKLLKFIKGQYFIGEEEVEIGTQYAALMFEERRGWVKFVDGKPVDYRIGLVRDGYVPPSRESLGDKRSGLLAHEQARRTAGYLGEAGLSADPRHRKR